MKFPRLRVSEIFLVVALLLTLVGGTAVSLWHGRETYRREEASVLRRDAQYAHTLSRSVSIFLSGAVAGVSTLAAEAGARPELTPEHLDALVERFAKEIDLIFISMYVIGPDGVEISDYFPSGETPEERVAGVGVDLSDRPYFKEAMETRAPVVSEAVIGRSTRRPVVVVAVPILAEDGSVRGVAAGSLDLRALLQLGRRAIEEDASTPVILDAAGRVVVHRDEALVGALADFGALPPARAAFAGGEGTLKSYQEPDGATYSAAYAPVPGFGWAVWVAHGTDRLAALGRQAFVEAMVTLLLMLLAAAAAFTVVSRSLLRPLKQMSAQTERIAAGDLRAQVELKGSIASVEVMALTEKFNGMVVALRNSIEMQKQMLSTKTQFLDVVAHVFRTPITILKWWAESWMERRDELAEEQKRGLYDSFDAIQRLTIGFDNVLLAQEISQNVQKADFKPVKIDGLIDAAIARLKPLAEIAGVAIRRTGSCRSPILGDERMLGKAIEVVVANGIFYNNRGGTLHVGVAEQGGRVSLFFEDTGIGILKTELANLFQPFFRGELARKKSTDGSGLGLFIAKSYVDMHGGSIEIASDAGAGTRVIIDLPRGTSAS